MRVLNNVILTLENKIRTLAQKVGRKTLEKKNGGSEIIAVIILIVIVVGVCITFKDSFGDWIDTLTGFFDDALDNFTL